MFRHGVGISYYYPLGPFQSEHVSHGQKDLPTTHLPPCLHSASTSVGCSKGSILFGFVKSIEFPSICRVPLSRGFKGLIPLVARVERLKPVLDGLHAANVARA